MEIRKGIKLKRAKKKLYAHELFAEWVRQRVTHQSAS